MSESILNTIKHMVGPSEDYEYFDTDLIVHINSTFNTLFQLGVGADRSTPFFITGDSETWEDFCGNTARRNFVKQYLYFKTRLAFDPPQSSFVMESMKNQIAELETRMIMMEEIPVYGGEAPVFDYDNYRLNPDTGKWEDGDE